MSIDVLGGISAFGGGIVSYLIPFLFVLTIVVFFHELGHFLVARWCGIRVLAFSIGFGPELAGFTDRQGTRWKIAAIPLGGYVKFLGDDNAASVPDQAALAQMSETERRGSFAAKPVAARAAVVARSASNGLNGWNAGAFSGAPRRAAFRRLFLNIQSAFDGVSAGPLVP